jgi:hypothetical protein
MKKILIMLLSVMGSFAQADTCPPAKGLDLMHPPAGWKLLLPPAIEGQRYEFGAAIHSLNGAYYYEQVICKYESCPSHFCPAFALISDKTYQHPNTKAAPWDARSVLGFTFTCISPEHDPAHCVFS